jgi:hypothetical protein
MRPKWHAHVGSHAGNTSNYAMKQLFIEFIFINFRGNLFLECTESLCAVLVVKLHFMMRFNIISCCNFGLPWEFNGLAMLSMFGKLTEAFFSTRLHTLITVVFHFYLQKRKVPAMRITYICSF